MIKYLLIILLMTNAQASCFNVKIKTNKARTFLLAMSANTGELSQTDQDLEKFSRAIQTYFQIPQQTICKQKNVYKAQMIRQLKKLQRLVRPQDRVIIYFSGHGSHVLDDNGDEKDGLDEVLIPYDVHGFFTDKTPSLKDVIRDDHFIRLVNKIKSNHIISIIDACYAGGVYLNQQQGILKQAHNKFWVKGIFGTSLSQRNRKTRTKRHLKGRLFSATSESGKAWELPQKGGLFTHILVQNLYKTPKANLSSIFKRTAIAVKRYTQTHSKQKNNIQIPKMMGKEGRLD